MNDGDEPCVSVKKSKNENEDCEFVDELSESRMERYAGREEIGKSEKTDEQGAGSKSGNHNFILVKLATMGVVYICSSSVSSRGVVRVLEKVLKDVEIGARAAPRWCHRMLPVQATCSTNKEELQAAVSKLVKDHLDYSVSSAEPPINYAVSFNRRGVDASVLGTSPEVFGRSECIKIVTSAVEQVSSTMKVNLTSPQMVVTVELIPVAGIQSTLSCAVSVLPGNLVVSTPKLNVKPLSVQIPKSKKRKQL